MPTRPAPLLSLVLVAGGIVAGCAPSVDSTGDPGSSAALAGGSGKPDTGGQKSGPPTPAPTSDPDQVIANDPNHPLQPECLEGWVFQEASAGRLVRLSTCVANVDHIDAGHLENAFVHEWNGYCVYDLAWVSDANGRNSYQCDVEYGLVVGLNGDWY